MSWSGHRLLWLFLLLSLGVHLVIVMYGRTAEVSRDAVVRDTVLGVELQAVTASKVAASSSEKPPQKILTAKKNSPHATPQPATEMAPVIEPVLTAASTSTNASEYSVVMTDPVMADAQRTQKLGVELAKYFHYPALARRKGWEGRVVIEFYAAANGELQHIRVLESSGYHVLDEAAMDSARQLPPKFLVELFHGRETMQRLPLSYQLHDLSP